MRLERLVLDQASRRPDALAVVDTEEGLSYGELARRALSAGALLTDHGVRPGDRVLIYAPKSVDVVAAMIGCLCVGAVYVPIDTAMPVERARDIAESCHPKGAFVGGSVAGELVDLMPEWDVESLVARNPWPGEVGPPPGGTDDDLAYILYTSGSTGVPKGVSITHRNAFAFVDWAADELRLTPDDRLSNHAPFTFDLSVFDLYCAFRAGASVRLIPTQASYTPSALVELVHREGITVWYSVPSAVSLMVSGGGLLDRPAPPGLRAVVVAGEPCPIDLLRQLRAWSDARLLNLYGPTETNVCTWHEVGDADLARDVPPPIGRSCSGDECVAVTPDGRVAGPGEEGELQVTGPTVMRGYWGGPDQVGAYRTGDLVRRRDDGGFDYLGRLDSMVKVRGHRVELGEVETVLRRHGRVQEAVVAVDGEGVEARLVAYVTTTDGSSFGLLAAKEHCARWLPRYMLPDRVATIGAVPRTFNGKVDRAALAGA